jgi:ABC-type polar amino acid transport system ATPase subunit
LWQGLQPHLVWGENVAQAMQFALSAEADGGVVTHDLPYAARFAQEAVVFEPGRALAAVPAEGLTALLGAA